MTSPARFRHLRRFLGPRWLTQDENGNPDPAGYVLDYMKDGFMERLRQGLYASLPQNDPSGQTTAPPDALEAMGRDRRVIRGIGETDQSYAVRLKRWLDDRRRAGNPFMLMQKLAEYTGPGPAFRVVNARGSWYSRAADGTETALLKQENWDWDGEPVDSQGRLRWSRFWVIVYPNGLWETSPHELGAPSAPAWGSFTLADTIGTTATQEHVATLRHLVSDWKGEHDRCVNIIIALDPDSFDPNSSEPDGHWGTHSRYVDGVRVRTRLATARYFRGT